MKKIISGGINRHLSREPGFRPEDLAKDDFKAITKSAKPAVKVAGKRAKGIKKLGA